MLADNTTTSPNEAHPPFNLERIHALIAELETELAKAPPGADLQDLRDEIETLKNVLKSPKVKEGWIRESLHAVLLLREARDAHRHRLARFRVRIGTHRRMPEEIRDVIRPLIIGTSPGGVPHGRQSPG